MKLIKVRIPGERFWIRVIYETKDYIIGRLENSLVTRPLKVGDKIRLKKSKAVTL